MTNHFFVYWSKDQILDALQVPELDHAASNQFHRLSVGDVIWIVGSLERNRLVTIGPLFVAEIVGQAEAEARLPYDPWEASYHVLNIEKAVKPRKIDLTPVLSQLEFLSATSPKLNLEKPIGQQMQTMRQLTDQTVRLVQSLWNGTPLADLNSQTDLAEFDKIQSHLDQYESLDKEITALARREQSFLRDYLFQGRQSDFCAICGEEFPVSLLVAAHIKPRANCTNEERRDYVNNIVAMCLLGCDALFERGIIFVEKGTIRIRGSQGTFSKLEKRLKELNGKMVRAQRPGHQKYFTWKAQHKQS